jgi:hypothetical protein
MLTLASEHIKKDCFGERITAVARSLSSIAVDLVRREVVNVTPPTFLFLKDPANVNPAQLLAAEHIFNNPKFAGFVFSAGPLVSKTEGFVCSAPAAPPIEAVEALAADLGLRYKREHLPV